MSNQLPVINLMGPTASGKTAWHVNFMSVEILS